MNAPLLLLLLLLDCAAADRAGGASTINADKDDELIVQDHHRHLSTYADGGTDQACWYNKAFVTCKDFYGNTELNMGPIWDQYAIWGNYTVTDGDTITFSVSLDNFDHVALNADRTGKFVVKTGKTLVEHANFHACTIESGFCTPLLGKTPGLITHAPASNSVTGSEDFSINSMGPGEWNLIMHYRLWTPCTTFTEPGCNADNDTIRVDFAKGLRVKVLERIATTCLSGYKLTRGKCVACPAGTFEYQTQACIPVDSLHYMPTNTSVEADQLSCPPNTRTVVPRLENGAMTLGVVEGAEALVQCRCDDGYYLPDDQKITPTSGCKACPAGAVCRGTYFPPIAKVGYGKAANDSAHFIQCKSGCEGGSIAFTPTGPTTFTYATKAFSCNDRAKQFSALCSVCDTDAGYGRQYGEKCDKCTLPAMFYRILAVVMVAAWFPIQRKIITKYLRSMYTITSYVQYLGFYSQLNVPWPAGLMALFKGFSFFNLSLEAIHLSCGGLGYTDIWMLQMVLPLFYPAAALLNIAVDVVLAAIKPKFLMNLGWRPQRDFSLKALKDTYMPPALFFINMYFYTGISRSFEMLQCKPVDPENADAGEFLIANPVTKCWEGEHNTHVAIAVVGVLVYCVLLPLLFAYVLLVIVPKRGLQNKDMLNSFGFLYHRFEPELWWWELIEIFRKLTFVVIAAWGQDLAPINQSSMATVAVLLVLLLELYYHPFRSALFDLLEEFTTLTEVLILLLGILIISTTTDIGAIPGEFGWVETTTYVIIALALALVVYTLFVDAMALKSGPRNRALRAKHSIMMSHNVFNLEIHSEVVPAYVVQADAEAILRLQEVEDLVIGWSLRKRSPEDAEKFTEWQRMAANDPNLIKGVLSPKYRARQSQPGETTLASSYINSLLEIRQGVDADGGLNSAIYLLSEAGRGILLAWLNSEEATPEAIENIRIFFEELTKFDTARQKNLVSTFGGRALQATYSSHFDKGNQKAEKNMRTSVTSLLNTKPEPQLARWGSRTTVTRRLSSMTINVAEANAKGVVSSTTDGGTPRTAALDTVKSLLSELKSQMQCDAVLFVSSGSDKFPKLLSTTNTAKVLDEDWAVSSGTPLGLAHESKKAVAVSNILTDQRFDLTKVNPTSVSQICWPIDGKIILTAINKSATNTNAVIAFDSSDMQLLKVYGKVVMELLAESGVSKSATAA